MLNLVLRQKMGLAGLITTILLSCLLTLNSGQVQEQACMGELQPCLNYLNDNSHPPETCCRSLDNVIRSMPECLCAMMSVEGANQSQQAAINVTQAQTLPGRCGQHINPLGCVTGTPDARTRNSVPNSVASTLQSSTLIVAAAASIILSLKAF